MSRLVSIRIALVDRAPEPRGSTDEPLIEHPGAASGSHESLVVEAADKQRREPRIDGHQVKGGRRPAVLTACNEAVEQLRGCARDVRVCSSVLTEGKQTVGLLNSGREKTARPMVFEAPSDECYTIGQERRGQRVAGATRSGTLPSSEKRSGAARSIRPPFSQSITRGCHRALVRART